MNSDHIPHFKSSPAFNDFQIKLAQEFARFYAEIDRKNLTIQALTEERDELVRMANKLTNERDEARRSCCEFAAMVDSADTVVMYVDSNRFHEIAMRYMKSRGWDCFKENTND